MVRGRECTWSYREVFPAMMYEFKLFEINIKLFCCPCKLIWHTCQQALPSLVTHNLVCWHFRSISLPSFTHCPTAGALLGQSPDLHHISISLLWLRNQFHAIMKVHWIRLSVLPWAKVPDWTLAVSREHHPKLHTVGTNWAMSRSGYERFHRLESGSTHDDTVLLTSMACTRLHELLLNHLTVQ